MVLIRLRVMVPTLLFYLFIELENVYGFQNICHEQKIFRGSMPIAGISICFGSQEGMIYAALLYSYGSVL
jgi:hypothetical protein